MNYSQIDIKNALDGIEHITDTLDSLTFNPTRLKNHSDNIQLLIETLSNHLSDKDAKPLNDLIISGKLSINGIDKPTFKDTELELYLFTLTIGKLQFTYSVRHFLGELGWEVELDEFQGTIEDSSMPESYMALGRDTIFELFKNNILNKTPMLKDDAEPNVDESLIEDTFLLIESHNYKTKRYLADGVLNLNGHTKPKKYLVETENIESVVEYLASTDGPTKFEIRSIKKCTPLESAILAKVLTVHNPQKSTSND
ncbi:hypothetical protein [Vibrio barjaei]|uniref:hypothetical protein n=1 Tax=Vibrio barjaei TaxID=1676683 RepID=UPI002283710D|nr:hypothetical protein [Vibrio barjaei]MCY9874609.1 hypothetical protein [Vibrio barjaei]